MLDSLTAIYIEPHQCPWHQWIILAQGPICEIFAKQFWELAILKISVFLSRPFQFFCFIPMKISPNLYGRMDGLKFWRFLLFPENFLLCVILHYTVCSVHTHSKVDAVKVKLLLRLDPKDTLPFNYTFVRLLNYQITKNNINGTEYLSSLCTTLIHVTLFFYFSSMFLDRVHMCQS